MQLKIWFRFPIADRLRVDRLTVQSLGAFVFSSVYVWMTGRSRAGDQFFSDMPISWPTSIFRENALPLLKKISSTTYLIEWIHVPKMTFYSCWSNLDNSVSSCTQQIRSSSLCFGHSPRKVNIGVRPNISQVLNLKTLGSGNIMNSRNVDRRILRL